MGEFLFLLLHTFLLCAAVCIDTFAAAFGFGVNHIRIPTWSALVLSVVSSATLALAIFCAGWLTPFLPELFTRWLSFVLLAGLGLTKLFDSAIKKMIRKLPAPGKELAFSFMRMRFLLHIYADPADADADRSSILSPKEAVALGLALSSDGLAAGLGSGFAGMSPLLVFVFSAAINLVCILTGCFAGRKTASRCAVDLSWAGGCLLLFMGICTLL